MTPLVITSLKDGHTHTRTHHGQDQFLKTRRAPAAGWHGPDLKITFFQFVAG